MSSVMFSVSYQVRPEKRNDYLAYVRELRERLRSNGDRRYDVYRAKGNENLFTEIYYSDSEEEIDALEENMDEETRSLLGKIEDCMEKGTTRYTTMMELE